MHYDHDHPLDADGVARARAAVPVDDEAAALADLFRLLGDPVRARMVAALGAVEELCVGDLALATGASDDAASYALRHLRAAGLVRRRRAGRVNYYRLADGRGRRLLEAARREGSV